jgi:membrane protein insertase Oxa1/YidC/SpoIIIJ
LPQANGVTWEGELQPNSEAVVAYQAIPPTTSSAGTTLQNLATLTAGDATLDVAVSMTTEPAQLGIWGRFVNLIASALVFFDKGLASLGIPYAFGFAIILFTVVVRGATFPLNMQQIKSSKAMQALQPQLKDLQKKV